jgi:hypothetical protein
MTAIVLGLLLAQYVMPILGSPVAPSGSTPTAVSDNFNRSNSTDLGSNWTEVPLGGFGVWNNALSTQSTGVYPSLAYWSANSFNANQYAQLTATAIQSNWNAVGPAVRVSSGNCYAASWHDTNVLELHKVVSGTDTVIGTSTTLAVGDVIRIEVSGTSVTVKKNGTAVIGPITDSALSSGSAGLYSNGAGAAGDDWYGGDL